MPRIAVVPSALTTTPFRGSEAVAAGLITRGMLAGRSWRRLFPDVYAHRDIELDHRLWCLAATMAAPASAAVGGISAACLWGAGTPRDPVPVHLIASRSIRLRRDARVTVHYTTLTATDVTLVDGLRVTTPERTIFDLGRRADRVDALAVLDAMLQRHLVQPMVLRRMMHERRPWPGVDRLAGLLPLADAGSESPMETRLRVLLVDAHVPPAVTQFTVRNAAGEDIARVDLAWPELRLAVEYDGDHHREPARFRRDIDRLNALRVAGWTVLRFTADDVLRRPGETARTVIATMAQLRRSPDVFRA